MGDLWVTNGRLVTPRGIMRGAVGISRGRIAAIRRVAPKGARTIDARGTFVAPGFIDLHVWGEPEVVSRDAARGGATAFLATLGPDAPQALLQRLSALNVKRFTLHGAECLGVHLEGPFLNPVRGGVLPKRAMRRASSRELSELAQASRGSLKLITLAPEQPGGLDAIRWCRRRRIVVSLGHSDADDKTAARAAAAGAASVTHIFNGMRPLHHRAAGLVDAALIDPRLTAMVIADGVHVSGAALRLLVRAKGSGRIALVTDNVRREKRAWNLRLKHGAFVAPSGRLAGSALTMMRAVQNIIRLGGASLEEAVRMASETPARLLGLRTRGVLAAGMRADLVAFGADYRVCFTVVGGRLVYQREKP